MEKITCNVFYSAKVMSHFPNAVIYKHNEITGDMERNNGFQDYSELGLFTYKKDAFMAIEAYRKIVNAAKLKSIAIDEDYSIEKEIIPENEMENVGYYNNVQEFINKNLLIEKCREEIGKDAINKILVDLGIKISAEQEKIIGRMVSDYVLKKREAELADNKYNNQIPNCQANIEFLNGLKNGK
jgi:hypothetical protein